MICSGPAAGADAKPAAATARTAGAKAAESSPKRIALKKIHGKGVSSQAIALAPGAAVQFIIAVKGAQNLFITPASEGLTFTLVKGTDDQFTKGDTGIYVVETKGNSAQRSEVVFDVKNEGAKEIKTSIRIELEDFGG